MDDDLANLNAEIGFSDDEEDEDVNGPAPEPAPIVMQDEDVVREEVEPPLLASRPQIKQGAAAVVVPTQLGVAQLQQHDKDQRALRESMLQQSQLLRKHDMMIAHN